MQPDAHLVVMKQRSTSILLEVNQFSIKQSEGNQENVTAMVTICADGTYLVPITIFKGKHIQKAWHKANSLLKMG